MHDMEDIAGPVLRALVLAAAFAMAETLLFLAAPVLVIGLLEGVVPTGDLGLLAPFAGLALVAGTAAAVVAAARHRIMLRAGLWLEHALAVALPSASRPSLRPLPRRIGELLAGRHAVAIVELPGAFCLAAAVALVSPRLALVGIATVIALVALAAAAALTGNPADAEPAVAAGGMAARYRSSSRIGAAVAIGRAVAIAGVTAAAILAVSHVVAGRLSTGAAVAGCLLVARAAQIAVAAIAALPALMAAVAAWRLLADAAALAEPARDAPAASASPGTGVAPAPASLSTPPGPAGHLPVRAAAGRPAAAVH